MMEQQREPLYRRILRLRDTVKPVLKERASVLLAWENVPADIQSAMMVPYRQAADAPKVPRFLLIGNISPMVSQLCAGMKYTACADWYADDQSMLTADIVYVGIIGSEADA
jgi:hypothetical protein